MKSTKIASFLFVVALAAGCSSIELNTEGGQSVGQAENDIALVLAADSQGK